MSGAYFEWWRSNADGAYFYEPTRDTLLRSDGDSLVNTSSIAMLQRGTASRGTLSIGAIHTLTRVFDAPGNQIQKLGVIAVKE